MANYNCRICKSKQRLEIEESLGNGLEFREVAKKFSDNFDCDLHLLEQSLATHYKKHTSKDGSAELTSQDLELLDRFERGELGFDEMQRQLAVRAFAKILKNPDSIHIRDWLQSELLKIKQQEIADKSSKAMELVNRMFAGCLPPEICPDCGKRLWGDTRTQTSVFEA